MSENRRLPILPLRDPDLVVFPGLFCEVDVGRDFSISAVKFARDKLENRIIIAMQSNPATNNPKAKDFNSICTEAEIKSILPLDNEGKKVRVILVGVRRAKLNTVGTGSREKKPYLYGTISTIEEPEVEFDEKILDSVRQVRELVADHLQFITIE